MPCSLPEINSSTHTSISFFHSSTFITGSPPQSLSMGLLSRLIDSFKPPEPPPVPVISPEKLAEILKSDATLKKEWYRLCPLLPVAHPCLPLWESLVNKGLLDVGSVYVRIFDLWLDSANVENPPNIPKLSEALDSLHFYNAESKEFYKITAIK